MMQGFNQSHNLPVPANQVDQRFFSNNLPDGNDAVPQVQLSQFMQQNQPVGLKAIGLLRAMAQGACQKSPIHTFTFNLLCQNGFQNQLWQQICQMVIDFAEFLIAVKGYPMPATNGYHGNGQDGATVAAQKVLEATYGLAFATYPPLQQMVTQDLAQKLHTAYAMYNSIVNDISQYKSGAYRQQQPSSYGYTPNNLPQINVAQNYNRPGYGHAQVSGQAHVATHGGHSPQYGSHAPASGEVQNSLYDVPTSTPLTPKEEISNETPYDNAYYTEPTTMTTQFVQASAPTQMETTDLPIPTGINEVVIDPTYYQPNGFKLDINRAYDIIHNPGGVVIRPAQLTDWEITPGDDAHWPQLVDPRVYCVFHVKFPNGVVKEKFVEWTDAMQYLRHELDAELRRKAYRPNGIVVSSTTPISTIGGDAVRAEEVKSLVEDGHIKASSIPPVILDTIYQGSDLEVEQAVREEMSNLLQTNFNSDVPMPAVEYRSSFVHPIPLTDTAFVKIGELRDSKNLGQIAQGLRDLTLQGDMSIRVFRVLNDRLTKVVNATMRDSMGLTFEIDDFCEDYLALEDHLEKTRGQAMRRVLQGAAEMIINRALTVTVLYEEDESSEATYAVADNFYNHQLGWDLDDIATLNLKSGKATLISAIAHPTILETLKGMISRANAGVDTFTGVLRLITRDGYYLELMKGRLVENAHLLKLVK